MAALDQVTIWRVIGLAVVTGTANAVYTPAMHSSIPSLVEESDLLEPISLNSVQFNLARAVGPALAGLLYGAIGPAGCFAVNASGFLVLAVIIARLRLPPRPVDGAAAAGARAARGPGLRAAARGDRSRDVPGRGDEPVRLPVHHHDARAGARRARPRRHRARVAHGGGRRRRRRRRARASRSRVRAAARRAVPVGSVVFGLCTVGFGAVRTPRHGRACSSPSAPSRRSPSRR